MRIDFSTSGSIIQSSVDHPLRRFSNWLSRVIGGNKTAVIVIAATMLTGLAGFTAFMLLNKRPPVEKAEIKPVTTGAILIPKDQNRLEVDKKTDELLAKTPLTTDKFSLEFSVRQNLFVVSPVNGAKEYQTTFLEWLNQSPYRILPASYFTFAGQ